MRCVSINMDAAYEASRPAALQMSRAVRYQVYVT